MFALNSGRSALIKHTDEGLHLFNTRSDDSGIKIYLLKSELFVEESLPKELLLEHVETFLSKVVIFLHIKRLTA